MMTCSKLKKLSNINVTAQLDETQHRTGSLYGGTSQGVDWPTRLFRQRPVLGLRRRARGTSTLAALGDWTETNTVLQLFYLQTSFKKQLQCFTDNFKKSGTRDSAQLFHHGSNKV